MCVICSVWVAQSQHRADSRFVPSQWETALLCNDVSQQPRNMLSPGYGMVWSEAKTLRYPNRWWPWQLGLISVLTITAWISNCIHCFMWGVFIRPCNNFYGGLKLEHGWVIMHRLYENAITCSCLNSSSPSAWYKHRWIGSALIQMMAWGLFDTKQLSKPMLGYYQLDPYEQTSVKF